MSEPSWDAHVHVYQRPRGGSYHMNNQCQVNFMQRNRGQYMKRTRVAMLDFITALAEGRVCHVCLPKERQLRWMVRRR